MWQSVLRFHSSKRVHSIINKWEQFFESFYKFEYSRFPCRNVFPFSNILNQLVEIRITPPFPIFSITEGIGVVYDKAKIFRLHSKKSITSSDTVVSVHLVKQTPLRRNSNTV